MIVIARKYSIVNYNDNMYSEEAINNDYITRNMVYIKISGQIKCSKVDYLEQYSWNNDIDPYCSNK